MPRHQMLRAGYGEVVIVIMLFTLTNLYMIFIYTQHRIEFEIGMGHIGFSHEIFREPEISDISLFDKI
jgi:hypothetical protein